MGLNKYQKDDFTTWTAAFHQKSIFYFWNPFTNISGYLNLWGIFKFILDNLEWLFFIKLMVAEKNNFIQMLTTILETLK